MLPSVTSLPSFIALSRSAGDLGCLVMMALISEHTVANYFADVRLTDDGVTDEGMADTLRRKCDKAMEHKGADAASQGWSGSVCSGTHTARLKRHSTNC